ncbi:YfdQ family protein [Mesorhizobium sp. M0644]|uniref:DUF2303 family protein n=1 Tax=Mesorhizobium sp. M0644 TaxID=2956979 RepID=UPI003335F53E
MERNVLPSMASDDGAIQSAIRAGMGLVTPIPITTPDGGTAYIVPDGFSLEKLPPLLPPLTGIKATPRMDDAESFVNYINRYKTGASVIFADLKTNLMTAIIDYHNGSTSNQAPEAGKDTLGKPDYTTHRVAHPCPWTIEWARWRAVDGQNIKQAELAVLLEEMLHTIAAPEGGALLEIAAELKVEREVKFKQGTKLADGTVSIGYEESDQTSTKSGKITVPDLITIVCPVFQGGEVRQFQARLRYKVDRGELTFKIAIMNRQSGEQAAFQDVVRAVSEATGQPVFYGAP